MNRVLIPSTVALLCAFAGVSLAETTADASVSVATTATTTTATATQQSTVATRLDSMFSTFAGSSANAQSLVQGLRTGSSITLIDANNVATTFSPPTKPMGWGNVKIALALAQAELTKAGISNPTPADIQAALNGGTVNNVTFAGVLAQRAGGMGWGQIAHADGLNLGKVVSAVSAMPNANAKGGASAKTAQTKGLVSGNGAVAGPASDQAKTSHTVVTTAAGSTAAISTARGHGAMAAGHGNGISTAGGVGAGRDRGHGRHGG